MPREAVRTVKSNMTWLAREILIRSSLISLQDGGVTPVNPTQQNQYLTRPQRHLVSNELPFLGRSSAGLVHSDPSAASDPQAGRQGKEGWGRVIITLAEGCTNPLVSRKAC